MQFLKQLFTWWHGQTLGTALHTFSRGKLVGTDTQGNKYFIDKSGRSINGKTRRWVIYNGDIEASRVPPEWHGWLHYTVDETPLEIGDEIALMRKDWHQPHEINQTGLTGAHKGVAKTQNAQADSSGYEAWLPK